MKKVRKISLGLIVAVFLLLAYSPSSAMTAKSCEQRLQDCTTYCAKTFHTDIMQTGCEGECAIGYTICCLGLI